MARSPITGAERAPAQPAGRDVDRLGPSDTSDSGSDVQGELDLASPVDLDKGYGVHPAEYDTDTDSRGTGERGAALSDEDARAGADVAPDRIGTLGGDDDEQLTDAELEAVDALGAVDEEDDGTEEPSADGEERGERPSREPRRPRR